MIVSKLFITGIGTDVGKTITSAIFTKALDAYYWKPIQCGELSFPDRMKVMDLASIVEKKIIPSAYEFSLPQSPHAAAAYEGQEVMLERLLQVKLPSLIIIEGAGGVLVPLNNEHDMIDLAKGHQCDVVVIIRYYLGCINHSLLTLSELKRRGTKVLGIVFNGERDEGTREIILKKTGLPCLLDVDQEKHIDPETISRYSEVLKVRLNELL